MPRQGPYSRPRWLFGSQSPASSDGHYRRDEAIGRAEPRITFAMAAHPAHAPDGNGRESRQLPERPPTPHPVWAVVTGRLEEYQQEHEYADADADEEDEDEDEDGEEDQDEPAADPPATLEPSAWAPRRRSTPMPWADIVRMRHIVPPVEDEDPIEDEDSLERDQGLPVRPAPAVLPSNRPAPLEHDHIRDQNLPALPAPAVLPRNRPASPGHDEAPSSPQPLARLRQRVMREPLRALTPHGLENKLNKSRLPPAPTARNTPVIIWDETDVGGPSTWTHNNQNAGPSNRVNDRLNDVLNNGRSNGANNGATQPQRARVPLRRSLEAVRPAPAAGQHPYQQLQQVQQRQQPQQPQRQEEQPDLPVAPAPAPAPAPLVSLRNLPLSSNPLYGRYVCDRDGVGYYYRTERFDEWREEASEANQRPDDFWHQYIRQKDGEEDQLGSVVGQASEGIVGQRDLDIDRPTEGPAEPPSHRRARILEFIRRHLPHRSPPVASETAPVTQQSAAHGQDAAAAHENDDHDDASMVVARGRTPSIMNLLRSASARIPSRMSRGPSRMSLMGPRTIRIAVIGDSLVGKTALLHRLYTGEYMPTEPSLHHVVTDHQMTIDSWPIILEIWDIPRPSPDAGNPLMTAFFHLSLICIDLSAGASSCDPTRHLNALRTNLVDSPVFLVGLKRDARPTFPALRLPFLNEGSPVSREQGEKMAKKLGAAEYLECSAKTDGEGVTEVFERAVRYVLGRREDEEKRKKKAGWGARRISRLFSGEMN